MNKRKVIKDDGRYLIYYAFERPFPEVHADQVANDQPADQNPAEPATGADPGRGSGTDPGKEGQGRV